MELNTSNIFWKDRVLTDQLEFWKPAYNNKYQLFEMLPFYTRLDHVTGHQLQSGLQMFAKLLLWPVEVSDKGLEGI